MKRRRGFTIIELLVVIAIIGVLMGIINFAWGAVAARSRDNQRKADLARIKTVLEQYALEHRSYPTFDASIGGGRIYAAESQLTGGAGCAHASAINERLAPKYIAKIPRDPKNEYGCTNVNDQSGTYLYLSSPAAQAPSVGSSATGYALLATLERSTDQISADKNPVLTALSPINYYAGADQSKYNFDANYLITGGQVR